jgi:broad specificity phosphatase PhoE
MSRCFYFITHANVAISKEMPVPCWPLSEQGTARMQRGLRQPWVSSVTSIYCSKEQKAIDGARILSEHLSLNHSEVPELGENDRSTTGFLPPEEFELVANEFFANPYRSVRGWERAIDAQTRIVQAISRIADTDRTSGSMAIISHGAVGTLLYCQLAGQEITRRWDQPANGGGNFFSFTLSPREVHSWWQVFDEDAA